MGGSTSVLIEFSDRIIIAGSSIIQTSVRDDQIDVLISGSFDRPTYVLTVNNDATVAILNSILSNFTYELSSSIIDGNTMVTVVPYSGGSPVLFSNIRSKMGSSSRPLLMSIILLRSRSTGVKAFPLDYQTIESTEKTRNINVYANRDGNTNYFDTELPVQVTMGVMTNLSNDRGEFVLDMTLINGVVTGIDVPWFVTSISYVDNIITITCSEARTLNLRSKIYSGGDSVGPLPPILSSTPDYNYNVITIKLLGTKLNTVTNYDIGISLFIGVQ